MHDFKLIYLISIVPIFVIGTRSKLSIADSCLFVITSTISVMAIIDPLLSFNFKDAISTSSSCKILRLSAVCQSSLIGFSS